MSQSPEQAANLDANHPYAAASAQLNKLVRLGHSFSGHERNCCYLNSRDGRFANVSAVSGLDYPEDGRAVVRTDWDFDGDLDLWVSNRTGPRLRFLRNELSAESTFVAFHLRGTESNRDAVGARVELQLGDQANKVVLLRTKRAGEGFLGQSSPWVHFGLGERKDIRGLAVRWPTGRLEQFELPQAGRYYQLVEGSGECQSWEPPSQKPPQSQPLQAAIVADKPQHHLLGEPVPLPPLRYKTFSGEEGDASLPDEGWRLLNLWASWCRPCLTELAEWSQHTDPWRAAEVSVVALTVDGVGDAPQQDLQTAQALVKRLQPSFTTGAASTQLVELVQMINNMIYQHDHRTLPVPTSFLIDPAGRLVAIYKGPVSVERVLQDMATAGLTIEQRQAAALPFRGRWIGAPAQHKFGKLAAQMWEAGLGEEAIAFAERMTTDRYRSERIKVHWANATNLRADDNNLSATSFQLREMLRLNPRHPEALMELGVIVAKQGSISEAAKHFQAAVRYFQPPNAVAHFNYGKALRFLNKANEAKQQFQQAVLLDPNLVQVRVSLGVLLAAEQKFEDAAIHFAAAWDLDRSNDQHLLNLASALLHSGKVEQAGQQLEKALQQDTQSIAVRATFAQVLMQLNRIDEAIEQFEKVVQTEPKASKIWYQLAKLAEQKGDQAQSLRHLRKVLQLLPDDPVIQAEVAGILATADDLQLRDGKEALRLATVAAKKTKREDSRILEILAAAYAQQGMFTEAVQAQKESIKEFRTESGRSIAELQRSLEEYQQKKLQPQPSK